jgi:polygalacturonase
LPSLTPRPPDRIPGGRCAAPLQEAIDGCPAGQAVELSSSGAGDAFLTRPIVLKAGVTLLVDADVTVTNTVGGADPAAYDCTGRFTYLAGVLFTTSPSVATGSPVTLTTVLQPAIYGAAAPTGTVAILEGSTVVASAAIAGRVTSLTLPGVGQGPHRYTARYSGDATYPPSTYGDVTVTPDAAGGG